MKNKDTDKLITKQNLIQKLSYIPVIILTIGLVLTVYMMKKL